MLRLVHLRRFQPVLPHSAVANTMLRMIFRPIWRRHLCAPGARLALLVIILGAGALLIAQTAPVTIAVTDENGVAISSVHVSATAGGVWRTCETDYAGRCNVRLSTTAELIVSAQKQGFYRLSPTKFASGTNNV